MRAKEDMLKDAHAARRIYPWLTMREDMRMIRLAQDVTELLETMAEKDETIRCLNIDLELKDQQATIMLRDNQLYIERVDAEIERLEADRRRLIGFRHCPQCGDWLIDIDYGDGRIGGMGCIECDFEMEVR